MNAIDNDYCKNCGHPLLYPEKPCPNCGHEKNKTGYGEASDNRDKTLNSSRNNSTRFMYLLKTPFLLALIAVIFSSILSWDIQKVKVYWEVLIIAGIGISYSVAFKEIMTKSYKFKFTIYFFLLFIFKYVFLMIYGSAISSYNFAYNLLYFPFIIMGLAIKSAFRLVYTYLTLLLINRISLLFIKPPFKSSAELKNKASNYFYQHKNKAVIITALFLIAVVYIAYPKPNSFIKAGTLSHNYYKAIVLKDGRVLLLDNKYAEIYNPDTKKFKAIEGLKSSRGGFSATLLQNGKVLIAGGDANNISTADCELFDPISETFKPTAKMLIPRGGHSAILLPNGKVLIMGGESQDIRILGANKYLSESEIYDPVLNKFVPAGNMVSPKRFLNSVLLSNGKVLVMGHNGAVLSNHGEETILYAELYDPNTNTFKDTGKPNSIKYIGNILLLPDGKVLIIGSNKTQNNDIKEVYDPTTEKFTSIHLNEIDFKDWLGNFGGGNYHGAYSMTILPSGKLLIAGGNIGQYMFSRSISKSEICDIKTYNCVKGPNLNSKRAGHLATLLPNGKVFIFGGEKRRDNLSSAEFYIEK